MRPVRSGGHEIPTLPDERVQQHAALTQSPSSLEISDLHFATVMEVLPGFVWSAFPDGQVEFCNQRWLDYAGFTLDQVKGRGFKEAIHPQDKSAFQEKWRT